MKSKGIVTALVALTASSPRLRQKVWQWIYNKIARRDASGKFIFMNYGYHDEQVDSPLSLQPQDEPFRYFAQLYNHVVQDIDLHDKDVLEVGCGRGGGGSFLVRYKNPRSYIGIDLSDRAIAWCASHYPFPNACWKQGLADALPIPDSSVDIVVNVESSHCYPNMDAFLSEAARTLRPNGYLALCDIRLTSAIEKLDTALTSSGLRLLKRREITSQVLHALDHVSQVRDAQITSVFPALFRKAVRDFAAVKDSTIYNMLKSGEMKYISYLLQKRDSLHEH
ncbi:MAG: class I SAM-dependent methyltransferase [Verrucomicrobia bacterium]|nr:class I SAM-dependent methyltransferase [Verrucomicrobiota bacterium]